MTNKIKHKVTIYEKIANITNPFANGTQEDLTRLIGCLSLNNNHFNNIMKTIHLNNTPIHTNKMTQQIVKNKKVITRQIEKPTLGIYNIEVTNNIYKGNLTVKKLEEIVYSNDFPYFDKVDEKWINDTLNTIKFADGMQVYLEFEHEDNMLLLVRKVFTNMDKGYFFDCNKPSLYALNQENNLISYNHIPFTLKDEQYLRVDYYQQLSKLVYTTINPDENRVYPAIIVTDMDNNTIEIHFTYKGEYVSEEILNDLKPHRLKDDYKSPNYFSKEDIEFLDMLRI